MIVFTCDKDVWYKEAKSNSFNEKLRKIINFKYDTSVPISMNGQTGLESQKSFILSQTLAIK